MTKFQNLPSNATTTIFTDSSGVECIEIGVPMDDELLELQHPILFGRFKSVNATYSINFSIDFQLVPKTDGDYVFEATTIDMTRSQFQSIESMINRIEQIYSEYYDKCANFNPDSGNCLIQQIKDYFGNIATLKIIDTDMVIHI